MEVLLDKLFSFFASSINTVYFVRRLYVLMLLTLVTFYSVFPEGFLCILVFSYVIKIALQSEK